MMSRDPRPVSSSTLDANDRLSIRTPADLAGAITTLAVALDRAATTGDSARGVIAQAERQLAKALEQAHTTPIDKTTLLIHLVAARAFLREGPAPEALLGGVGRVIARVHALAGASPAAFC